MIGQLWCVNMVRQLWYYDWPSMIGQLWFVTCEWSPMIDTLRLVNFVFLLFAYSVQYLRTFSSSLSLRRCNSDAGSPNRLLSSLRTTVRAFIFIAKIRQPFFPSLVDSHRIDWSNMIGQLRLVYHDWWRKETRKHQKVCARRNRHAALKNWRLRTRI